MLLMKMREDLVFIADLIYECKKFSFSFTNNKIKLMKSNGVDNFLRRTDLDSVSDSKNN